MVTGLLSIVYVLVCFLLCVVVLMQTGKGGGISGAFGLGGASQTIFGASGAGNALTRATTILGGTFMLLSLLLALLSVSGGPATQRRSVLQPNAATESPATPGGEVPGSELPSGPAGSSAGQAPVQGAAPAPAGTQAPATPAPPPSGTSGGTGN